jgi:hypothetical protein
MTTQVIFKIDPRLKQQAVRRAKTEGITYSAFLKSATRAFVAGDLSVGIVRPPEIPNKRTARLFAQIDADVAVGRNLSPLFSDAQSAIAYLKKKKKR